MPADVACPSAVAAVLLLAAINGIKASKRPVAQPVAA
jgi:hypothetical protein